MVSLNPVRVMKHEADEEKAEIARLSSFVGAMAVGDLVKTTLGPRGMDKILWGMGRNEGQVQVTNDGATILRSVGVDNPAAKIIVEMARVQDEEVGDGTTSVAVFASELLRQAEKLIDMRIHPQTIIAGWRKATDVAKEALKKSAVFDNVDDAAKRQDLMNIAMTTLSSKFAATNKEMFANLAVDAVLRLKGSGNRDAIQVIKVVGGDLSLSFLDEGFILKKKIGQNQPKRIENAKIMVANTPMDADKVKVFGSKVKVDSIKKVAEIEEAEKQKMKDKVNRILKHDINVFVNRQLIYNYPEQLFADANVMAIEHADFDGVERLALVTGGEIASTFGNTEAVTLGTCKLIEEVMIGEEKMIKFSGCAKGEACTVVLRGATQQIVDEAERALHDVLCVLIATIKNDGCVYGGGCGEMLMANAVMDAAAQTPGKESKAMEGYAEALRQLPGIIAENGGYDAAELITQLRAAHTQGKSTYGLDMNRGEIGDMAEMKVVESYYSKKMVVSYASEAAEMIVRVDDIIKAAPRKRTQDHHPC